MRFAAALVAALSLSACDLRSADPTTVERELLAANAEYDQALIEGDAVKLDRFYSDDFQIIDDDAGIHGKRDQIDFMTEQVDLQQASSDDIKVTILGPEAAMLTGRFIGRYQYQGKENDFTERYTSIWVRQNGEWRVKHEHASLVPKPEAPDTR